MDARKCLNGGQFDIAKLEPLCSAVTHNGQSEPIQANPMPILANPMPISCHYWGPFVPLTKEQVLYVGWSLVYSEDEFKANFHVIDLHGIVTGSNSLPSMPILTNPVPIPSHYWGHSQAQPRNKRSIRDGPWSSRRMNLAQMHRWKFIQ